MPMRHPLRNDWDRMKFDLAIMAGRKDRDAVSARVMLKLMPPFLEILEEERDNNTPPAWLYNALNGAAANLLKQSVRINVSGGQREALRMALAQIEREVLPQLADTVANSSIVLPGGHA